MRKLAGLLLIAVLTLTGCAATPPHAAETKSEAAQQPAETPAPLVPDEAPAAAQPAGDDATYLAEVRLRLKGMDNTTDQQLIEAGHEACDAMEAGTPRGDVDVIQGDAPGEGAPGDNDGALAYWAAAMYCPEFS